MKIGIITAMPMEFRAVAACFNDLAMMRFGAFRAGHCNEFGHEYWVIEAGMGFDNAAGATEALVLNSHPDLLISTGFCGGIDKGLQVGDVVVAERIVIAADGCLEEIPVLLSPFGQTFIALQADEKRRMATGTFVSTPVLLSKGYLAGLLPDSYGTPVAEMESAAIGIIATENLIPLLAIRVVSDSAAEEPGFSLSEFCSADMRSILPHKVLLKVLHAPRIIPQLIRLSRYSRRAAENLTTVLIRLFSSLDDPARR